MIRKLKIVILGFALVLPGAQTRPTEEWRPEFDKVYALADGEILKRVPPPFIDERFEFLGSRAEGRDPSGLAAMVIEWRKDPFLRSGHGNAAGEGLPLSRILEFVLELKPYEIDAPREMLDREFPGDWVVRPGADAQRLLDSLARIMGDDAGVQYQFSARKEKCEVVVVRGRLTIDVDPFQIVKLDLPVKDVLFREHFGGGAMLKQFYSRLSAASGWAVIDATDQKQFFARIEYGDDENHELAPPEVVRIPREQMEEIVRAIGEQTGLELKFEEREILRWALEEK